MSDIAELECGVDHARENLVRTLDEFNRKATATAQELRASEEPIRRYPLPSLCGAMALGFRRRWLENASDGIWGVGGGRRFDRATDERTYKWNPMIISE